MLENHVIPQLKRKRIFNKIIFMRDGAPPYFARKVRNFLQTQFRNRVIGRGFATEWPARSPDSNPHNYWF